MLQCLPPVIDERSEILILGSMPGNESLKQQMYYAHKYNRFWRIIFKYFNAEYSEDKTDRLNLALSNKIALFDCLEFCERPDSSLDARIKHEIPNDIETLLVRYPRIRGIILNGKKAESVYIKHFRHLDVKALSLPSTSPANASFDFEKLYGIWSRALNELF